MAGALREVLARFGISADTRQLDRADRRVSSTRNSLRSLVAAAGGAATLIAMRRFVSQTVAMGDDLDKTSQQVGLTTRELQAFRHAAELSGVDAAGFATAMGQLQLKAQQAARDGGQQARIFSDLGIEIRDASGNVLSGGELLRNVADAMQRTTNPTMRTAAAMELMGRSGRRMLPMLTGGRAALAAMEAELDRLGGGASAEFIRQSVELTDDMTRLRLATTSLKAEFLTALLPSLTRAAQWMARTAAALSGTGAAASAARPILVALGVAAAGAGVAAASAWGAAIAPILAAGAAAALLYLAIEDVYMTAQDPGADTLTRRFLDWAVGADNARKIIQNLNQAIEDLRNTLATVAGFLGIEWGEEGTDRRRANLRGAAAWRSTQEAIYSALPIRYRETGRGEAPRLSRADEIELDRIRRRRREQTTESESWFQESFPSLAEWEQHPTSPMFAPQPMSIAGAEQPRARAVAPRQQTVTIDNHARTEVHVHAAEDPQATARVVRQELDRREAANNRAVLAAVEPARGGG